MLPKAGFTFTETMSGTWTRAGAPGEERPASFTVTARVTDLLAHLVDGRAAIEGRVTMEGFATDRPVAGHMIIAPVTRGLVRYEFDFEGDDGKRYRFAGQKDVLLSDVVRTMTVLPAAVTDESGAEVAQVTVRFDLTKDLVKLLASVRPRFAT